MLLCGSNEYSRQLSKEEESQSGYGRGDRERDGWRADQTRKWEREAFDPSSNERTSQRRNLVADGSSYPPNDRG